MAETPKQAEIDESEDPTCGKCKRPISPTQYFTMVPTRDGTVPMHDACREWGAPSS